MAVRFNLPALSFLNDNANPLAGGSLYFYESETSSFLATYSDDDLSTANTNPVVLDAAGRSGDIFLQPADYKVVVKDASGVTIKTMDPVHGAPDVSAILSVDVTLPKSSEPLNSATTDPLPGGPSDGDRYWVVSGINANKIAQWSTSLGGQWIYQSPEDGMSFYAQDTNIRWLWTGTVLTPDPNAQSPSTTQTGTSYTPLLADFSSMIDFTNAGAVAVTLPDHSDVPDLIVNSYVLFRLTGTGSVSINTEGSDTIQCTTGATSNIAIADRYGIVAAIVVAIDGSNNRTWALVGNVA